MSAISVPFARVSYVPVQSDAAMSHSSHSKHDMQPNNNRAKNNKKVKADADNHVKE